MYKYICMYICKFVLWYFCYQMHTSVRRAVSELISHNPFIRETKSHKRKRVYRRILTFSFPFPFFGSWQFRIGQMVWTRLSALRLVTRVELEKIGARAFRQQQKVTLPDWLTRLLLRHTLHARRGMWKLHLFYLRLQCWCSRWSLNGVAWHMGYQIVFACASCSVFCHLRHARGYVYSFDFTFCSTVWLRQAFRGHLFFEKLRFDGILCLLSAFPHLWRCMCLHRGRKKGWQ